MVNLSRFNIVYGIIYAAKYRRTKLKVEYLVTKGRHSVSIIPKKPKIQFNFSPSKKTKTYFRILRNSWRISGIKNPRTARGPTGPNWSDIFENLFVRSSP